MQTNHATTAQPTNTKGSANKTPKTAKKQDHTAELQQLREELEKAEDTTLSLTADLRSLEDEKEDLKNEIEKLDIENAMLRANAEAELEAKTKELALLQDQLERIGKKPTHATAEEKQKHLEELNAISADLERKKQSFKNFLDATMAGDEQAQFFVVFHCTDGTNFKLANHEIVEALILKTKYFMENAIKEKEFELLNYQI